MAVVISYLPTDTAAKKVVRYYVCDLVTELPSVFSIGDLSFAANRFFIGTSGGWLELTASGGGATNAAVGIILRTNVGLVAISKGQTVAVSLDGLGIILASPGSKDTIAIGLAGEDIMPSDAGIVITHGVVSFADWTEATGGVSLVPNKIYYLDTISGKMATSPPPGLLVQMIGKSVSTTILSLAITDSVGVT